MSESPRITNEIALEVLAVLLLVSFLATGASGCSGFHAARMYHQGTVALNAGKAEQAVARLGEAGQLLPDVSQIQNHLGLAYVATGQREKALAAFHRAVEIDCSNAAAAYNLALARLAAEESRSTKKTRSAGEASDER